MAKPYGTQKWMNRAAREIEEEFSIAEDSDRRDWAVEKIAEIIKDHFDSAHF